jgi:hypothetical protein
MISSYSRLQKLETIRNIRKTIIFVFLCIVVVVLLVFVGIPALTQLAGFLLTIKKGAQVTSNDDSPPAPPVIGLLATATNKNEVNISGNSESGSYVTIFVNDQGSEVIANSDGSFNLTGMKLIDGKNVIYALAKDSAGNVSNNSVSKIVYLDTSAPELTIKQPTDNQVFYSMTEKQISVTGTTEKECRVLINDHVAIVDSNGNFNTTVSLSNGENTVFIKSQDEAGNVTEKTLTVNYIQ